jgi:hypothetical protein
METISHFEGAAAESLTQRRFQQKGDLYEMGGYWKLRWREDQIDKDGKAKYGWSRSVHLGPSEGTGRLTKTEAHGSLMEDKWTHSQLARKGDRITCAIDELLHLFKSLTGLLR